jgi:mannose-6-phosphate isomerase-like protein (cupin superfamily)
MTLRVRRVVTGHDGEGRARVQIDELAGNVISRRAGHASCVIWTTEKVPANNSGHSDDATKPVGTSLENGTVFRVIEFGPGVAPRRHRTDSIDYAVVMSGEIHMELDDGEVHLKEGDVLVQRGTIHNWINRGTVPCVMAVVLVGAEPVSAGGKLLNAAG